MANITTLTVIIANPQDALMSLGANPQRDCAYGWQDRRWLRFWTAA